MLRNEEYEDEALLHVIADVANPDGVALSTDIAEHLGVRDANGRSPSGRIATRMSWMKRYKLIDKVDPRNLPKDAGTGWVITPLGEEMMKGHINKPVLDALASGKPGNQLQITRELAQRAYVHASDEVATIIRRSWLHNAAQRRRR